MKRIFSMLVCALIICVSATYAETNLVEADSEVFDNAINAFERKDFQTAVELFTALADQGEPSAQHNLSILYFKGLGSPVSYKRALYWAWRASLGGSEPAVLMFDDVRDTVTDELVGVVAEEIVVELTEKAMAGDTDAAERLGKTYYNLFVQPDLRMAYVWFLISQAFGNETVSKMIVELEGLIEVQDRITYQGEAMETFSAITK